MKVTGSCSCGAVKFTLDSNTPQPYMRCYCSICRKTAGGGGNAWRYLLWPANDSATPESIDGACGAATTGASRATALVCQSAAAAASPPP